MSDIAVQVENLGKKYRIPHQGKRGEATLREVLAQTAGSLFRGRRSGRDRVEEFWALRDVTLDVRRGDVVGIIGRNGAGKSTLLKLLSRITEPTAGTIVVAGRIASLLEVGTGFHNELTGRENIFLNGAILGMHRAEIRRKFDDIVEFSGVEQFLDTPVKYYSSGMYMRLAFSIAAHLEPDILVVDEVLAVGDAEFQKKCLGKMREVAEQSGRTVIFVSHNMQAVKSLCNYAAHLASGRLVSYGPTSEIVRGYLAAGSSNTGRWENERPGDDERSEVQLLSMEVSDAHGSVGVYPSSSELTISMTFRLREPMAGFCLGFDLVTADGTTVLRSYQTDQAEDAWPRQAKGVQQWSCRIPAGLLCGGEYFVSPRISIHNVRWLIVLEAVLQFEVILDHGVSPFWNSLSGKSRPGVVAPILEWTSDAMGMSAFDDSDLSRAQYSNVDAGHTK